jgi:muramoyltetrapeptide carboxypeptidase
MPTLLKPAALRRGDIIGVCAPAGPAIAEQDLHTGVSYLQSLGYKVLLAPHLLRRRGYLAGEDRDRASDLMHLFTDARVKAIIALRGGYGTQRILPLLDFGKIRRNPKIVVGYSDLTALSLALYVKAGLVSFAGPMVGAEMARGLTGVAEEFFWRCVTSPKPLGVFPGPAEALRGGTAEGRILGGNLSLVAAMAGTPYFPTFAKSLVLLEEIGERPYRVDRMLQQLALAGVWKRSSGFLLGTFVDCGPEAGKPSLSLAEVFDDTFRATPRPILAELHHGHVRQSLTVPIGIRARIGISRKLTLLESGVQ